MRGVQAWQLRRKPLSRRKGGGSCRQRVPAALGAPVPHWVACLDA